MNTEELQATVNALVVEGKGILAADESNSTAGKRLASINVESTEETRRLYREVMLTGDGMENFISGVILFEETLGQQTNGGELFPQHLANKGVVPGIKVDQGLKDIEGSNGEQYTSGLEGLGDRLKKYKEQGARFTKWRAAYTISDSTPSSDVITRNASDLAKYAKVCHEEGFVPIVEPEILIDGAHSIDKSEEVSRQVLTALYEELAKEGVDLKYTILKPSMVISGIDAENRADIKEVAARTVKILKECVPAEVPSINFLSGGQGAEEATQHLNEMHKLEEDLPWYVSFSYARALQGPALQVWNGDDGNIAAAQKMFVKRARLNGLATKGEYTEELENEE